jgi:glycosyltransferase involved in cell wall biosynthesis
MLNALRIKKIILVSNVTDHSGPTEGLASFLQKNSAELLTIYHPFFYCKDRKSRARLFVKGKLTREEIFPQLSLPEFVKYFVDLLLTIYYTLRFRRKFDLFIGVNCLHAFVGIVCRKLGLVSKVIFYGIDWMPRRFKNPFFNWLYFQVDRWALQGADYIWNLSEEMAKVRKKQGVPDKKNLLVPNGVNFDEIKRVAKGKIKRQTLVLLGALHESKGVDLVIKAMPKIWQEFPKVKLVVIGSTPKVTGIRPYEKIFRSLGNRVSVLGVLPHEKVLAILPEFGVGLSPYSPEETSLSRYAWPARVIDYLACGLPVVITPVPAVAQAIKKKKAGVLIGYNEKEFIEAIRKLLTNDQFYFQARKNAVALVKHLSWDNIFKKAFAKIGIAKK